MTRIFIIVFSIPLLAYAHDVTYTHEKLCTTHNEIRAAAMQEGVWLNNSENKKLKMCVTSQDSAVQVDVFGSNGKHLRLVQLESAESEDFSYRTCEIVEGSNRLQLNSACSLHGDCGDHRVCIKVTYAYER